MSRKWLVGVVVVAAVLVTTWLASGGRRPGVNRTARPTHPHPTLYVRPPVQTGTPGTAHAALYKFAVAYGSISLGNARRRQAQLIALSAPPLSSSLARTRASAGLEVSRGLAPGTRLTVTVVMLEIGARTDREVHAALAIEQRQVGAGAKRPLPVETAYFVVLTRIDGQWRVSRFVPVS